MGGFRFCVNSEGYHLPCGNQSAALALWGRRVCRLAELLETDGIISAWPELIWTRGVRTDERIWWHTQAQNDVGWFELWIWLDVYLKFNHIHVATLQHHGSEFCKDRHHSTSSSSNAFTRSRLYFYQEACVALKYVCCWRTEGQTGQKRISTHTECSEGLVGMTCVMEVICSQLLFLWAHSCVQPL